MHTSRKTIDHGRELITSAHEQWQQTGRIGTRPLFSNEHSTWELSTANTAEAQLDPVVRLARASLRPAHSNRPITAYLHEASLQTPRDFKLDEDHFLDMLPEMQEQFWTCQPSDLQPNINSRSFESMFDNYTVLSAGLRALSGREGKAFDGSVFTFNIGNAIVTTIRGSTAPDQETINLTVHDIGQRVRQRKGDMILRCDSILKPSSNTATTIATECYPLSNGPFPEGHRYLSEHQEAYLIGQVASKLLYTSSDNFTRTPAGDPIKVKKEFLEASDETAFDIVKPLGLYVPLALHRVR